MTFGSRLTAPGRVGRVGEMISSFKLQSGKEAEKSQVLRKKKETGKGRRE